MGRPNHYQTKQRDAILSYILSLDGAHVTAAQIASHFEKGRVPVGRTTVYRHLEQLTQSGQLRKYTLDGVSSACYQYQESQNDCESHYHLKCERCGELQHVDCDWLTEAQQHINEKHLFRINAAKTVFYGMCEKCEANG